MAVPDEKMDKWFHVASNVMFDSGWDLVAAVPDATISHRADLASGHLIKYDLRNIFVEDAPENPCDLLLLPEVRAQLGPSHDTFWGEFQAELITTYGPGDALLYQGWTSINFKLSILLGQLSGPAMTTCFYNREQVLGRQQMRRNFPEPGDCTVVALQGLGTGEAYLNTARREEEKNFFRIVVVLGMPQQTWACWKHQFFTSTLQSARKAAFSYMNRPGIQKMRSISANFYVILSLRNFNRGFPMIPVDEMEDREMQPRQKRITVSAGSEHGLALWGEFTSNSADGKFHLAEYLQRLVDKLAVSLTIYETSDGQTLVPYQCVVVRQQWDEMKGTVLEALRFQKAAYRRLHGGTTAPSLIEHLPARFASDPRGDMNEWNGSHCTEVVVRKTFLELNDMQVDGEIMRRIQSEDMISLRKQCESCESVQLCMDK